MEVLVWGSSCARTVLIQKLSLFPCSPLVGDFFFPLPHAFLPSLLPIFQVAKRFPLTKLFCIHFNARLYTSC